MTLGERTIMTNNIKKHVLFAGLTAAILLLSGCNTVEGFGKDLQTGGQAVQKAADESKHS